MTEATQATFAELDYMAKKRKTRRERFLERMDGLVPWKELEGVIRPHCPKAGRGRRRRASRTWRAHRLVHAGEKHVWAERWLPGRGEARRGQGPRRGLAGGDAPGPAPAVGGGRRGGSAGEGEGVGPRQGGASVLPCEADFRLRQGALPGASQERAAGRAAADRRSVQTFLSLSPLQAVLPIASMARSVSSRNLSHEVNCANGPLIGRFTSSCRRKRPKSRLIFCRRRPVASLAVRSAFSRMLFGSARRSASPGVGRYSGVRLSGFPTAVRMAASSRISHASVMQTGTTPTQCGASATSPTVFAISWSLASPCALSASLCTKSRSTMCSAT